MPSKYLKRAMKRRKLRKEKSAAFVVNLTDRLPPKGTLREDHFMDSFAYMHARQTVKQ